MRDTLGATFINATALHACMCAGFENTRLFLINRQKTAHKTNTGVCSQRVQKALEFANAFNKGREKKSKTALINSAPASTIKEVIEWFALPDDGVEGLDLKSMANRWRLVEQAKAPGDPRRYFWEEAEEDDEVELAVEVS